MVLNAHLNQTQERHHVGRQVVKCKDRKCGFILGSSDWENICDLHCLQWPNCLRKQHGIDGMAKKSIYIQKSLCWVSVGQRLFHLSPTLDGSTAPLANTKSGHPSPHPIRAQHCHTNFWHTKYNLWGDHHLMFTLITDCSTNNLSTNLQEESDNRYNNFKAQKMCTITTAVL